MNPDTQQAGTYRSTMSGLPVEDARLLDAACDAFETQWRSGGRPDIGSALLGLPESLRSAALFELILLDVFYRRRAGDAPTAAEYAGRFPDLDAVWLAGTVATDAEAIATGVTAETAEVRRGTRIGYFGDYELLDEIARGGMGIVYRARQLSLDRVIALKMIRSGEFAGPGEARRFRQEVEAVAALDHPHIVPIHEVGEFTGRAYYTMRLLEGGALSAHIAEFAITAGSTRTEARRRQTATAALIATVARAVHHAHQRGILHRDLKPSNILLDGKGEPHVVDFGLARRIGSASSLTATGAVLGTPSYMAPEQARGGSDVTTQADVYGLGAVLYELLTGRPPFKGIDALDTVAQVREREVTRPRSISPGLDRDLETICLKCLSKEAEKRYDSASALADDLDSWRAGEPILARRAGRLELARKWARRNPTAAGLVAVTALFLLAAVGGGVAFGYSRTLEGKNRELVAAKDDADGQRSEADKQRGRAEREEAESWRLLYFARMHQANAAFQTGNTERVIELLIPYRESTPGKPDPRGFEWHYLWRAARGDLFTVRAHPGGIDAVAYSADGRMIATGGSDGTVQLWNASTGSSEGLLDAGIGANRVTGVAFVPGTTRIAASLAKAVGGEIRLWDVRTLETVRSIEFAGKVNGLAIHPDGEHIAAACEDGLVRVTGAPSGRTWERRHGKPVHGVKFSGDGLRLAAGGDDGWFPLWRFREDRGLTDEILGTSRRLTGRSIDAVDLDFAGESRLVAVGPDPELTSTSGSTLQWNAGKLPAGEWKAISRTSPSNAYEIRRYRDIRLLPGYVRAAAITEDGTVFVHDLASDERKVVHRLIGHSGPGRALAAEPFGRFLASVGHGGAPSEPGELRVWDLRPYREELVLRGSSQENDISLSPDGQFVAAAFEERGKAGPNAAYVRILRVCSATTGKELHRLPSPNAGQWVIHSLFSPDGRWVAAAFGYEGVAVFRADTGAEVYRVPPAKNRSARVRIAFSPDGRLLAVCTAYGPVEVHDLEKRALVRRWDDGQNGQGEGASIGFSPDGTRLAFTHNNETQVLRIEDGTAEVQILFLAVTTEYSPDGRSIAAAGHEGAAIFSAADGRRLMTLIPESVVDKTDGRINSCRYTADGSRLLTASDSGFLRLWDTTSGQELLTLRPFGDAPGHPKVFTAAISPDGRRIAVNAANGSLRVIELPSADPIGAPDPTELVGVLYQESPLPEDAIARLKAMPGLDPKFRSAALRWVSEHPPTLDALLNAMWPGQNPGEPVPKASAEFHLRVVTEYLRRRPGNKDSLLERGIALYHSGRLEEARAALEALAYDRVPAGMVPAGEGKRLAYLAMTLVALGKYDEAVRTLAATESLRKQNRHWDTDYAFGEIYARGRKTPPLRIDPWLD